MFGASYLQPLQKWIIEYRHGGTAGAWKHKHRTILGPEAVTAHLCLITGHQRDAVMGAGLNQFYRQHTEQRTSNQHM